MRSGWWLSALMCLLLVVAPARADIQPTGFDLPPDDKDLQAVIERAAAYSAAANCEDFECPKTDCAAAKEALQALLDMEAYLDALVAALGAANSDFLAQFRNVAEGNIRDGGQLARTIWAIGVHEALHNFGSALLSIASLVSFAKDFATNPKAFEDLTPVEMLDRLNSWVSALRSQESLINTLAKTQGAPTSNPITGKFDLAGGVDTKSINDQISTINDVKKTINAAIKNGKDWRKALKEGGGAAALGQLAGRFLKNYSEKALKERQAAQQELLTGLAAGDLAQAQAYRNLQRVQSRRFLAEDALAAVREARAAYQACVLKVCGLSTFTRPPIPNFVEPIGGAQPKLSWGKALRWLNGALQATLPRLTPVAFRNKCMPQVTEGFFIPLLPGSETWCQYQPGLPFVSVPLTPVAPLAAAPQSSPDDPRDQPGSGTPTTPPNSTPQTSVGDPDDQPVVATPPPDDGPASQPPTVPLIIKATQTALQSGGAQTAVGRQMVKLFPDSVMHVALPPASANGAPKPQTDAGADPITCTTGADGTCMVHINPADFGQPAGAAPAAPMEIEIAPSAVTSFNLQVQPGTAPIGPLAPFVIDTLAVSGLHFITVMAPLGQDALLRDAIADQRGVIEVQENVCRDKQQAAPNDPYFAGARAWDQSHDDQWGLKRIGLTAEADSAWNLLGTSPKPVVVAVIDTGLDWNHLDFDWRNLWRNPKETPDNGADDDGNGYVDDVIGWDFLSGANAPWDHDGHGTLVAGIIAAAGGNGVGIVGVNPHARIMVLKALDAFGQTRASYIAKAIVYAADNGAPIINLSVGGETLTRIEQAAIAYARSKGVLIVVAAGNEGVEVGTFGPAGAEGVLTVAATNLDDSHPAFSNWGPEIDLAAPGVDILSLRARRTDTVLGIPGVAYQAGAAYVGEDKRYYRVSGTSFAAPFVAGVASLLLSRRPDLTLEQLETVLTQSAEDIQTPGFDQFSGAGLVNARRALTLDPSFSIAAAITGVEVVALADGPAVSVRGTAAANALAGAALEVGRGENPTEFTPTGVRVTPATDGPLGAIPAGQFRGAPIWTIRLIVTHANGEAREARFVLDVGG